MIYKTKIHNSINSLKKVHNSL